MSDLAPALFAQERSALTVGGSAEALAQVVLPTPAALEAVAPGGGRRHLGTLSCEALAGLVAAADSLVVVAGAILVFFGFYEPRYADSGRELTYAGFGGLAALFLIQRLWSVGAYTSRRLLDLRAQLRLVTTSWTIASGLLLLAVFLLHAAGELSRGWFLGWYGLVLVGLLLVRLGFAPLLRRLALTGRINRRGLALVGPRALVDRAAGLLGPALPHLRLSRHVLEASELEGGEAAFGGRLSGLRRELRHDGADSVLVLPTASDAALQMRLLDQLRELPVDVWYCPVVEPRLARTGSTSFGPLPALLVWPQPLTMTEQRIKRAADLVLAATALVLLSPLLLLAAIAVKLDSPGPIFFRQARFGFNNRRFEMLKFRTMHVADCDPTGARRTVRNDPRVTRVGRFLRRSSIDELPQLWNVLTGDMSIVGPRAHPIEMKIGDRYYHEVVEGYFARHRVRPGITGWAQVHGLRGEVDTLEKARARVAFDLHYVENWSLLLDLRILLLTVLRGLGCSNAY